MRLALDRLFDAAGWLSGLFMIGTLLAVLLSIAGRFVTALDVPGTDAYAGYCMAASAFLALAPTLRRGEHIRVTLLMSHLPPAAQRALDLACHAVALALAGALAWFSWHLVWQSHEFNDISTGLDATPLWIPQLGMALGSTLFALAFLADGVALARGQALRAPDPGAEPARTE
jgi:TRAP-type C4-dicarboxylate transport system permease small subunit